MDIDLPPIAEPLRTKNDKDDDDDDYSSSSSDSESSSSSGSSSSSSSSSEESDISLSDFVDTCKYHDIFILNNFNWLHFIHYILFILHFCCINSFFFCLLINVLFSFSERDNC